MRTATLMVLALALLITIVGDKTELPRLHPEQERIAYQAELEAHEYSHRPRLTPKEWKAVPKYDRPDLGWEQDFLRTKDPVLGYPPVETLLPVIDQINNSSIGASMSGTPGSSASPWVERGPNNVAGRTRTIMYDPNDGTNKKVFAGGVTGGLWFNNDITSSTTSWNAVDDFWDNIAVTCMTYDPNATMTMYVGTGEGWGTGSSRGAGVWKTTNGGTSWTQLTATSQYYYVNDIIVRSENGTSAIYVAVSEHFYQGQFQGPAQGLYRSTDGGTSFTQVLPDVPSTSNPYAPADLELGANNRIWVGTRRNSFGSGGGNILHSDDGTNWTVSHTVSGARRMELAVAPSDSNYVYALVEAGNVLDDVLRTTDMGLNWTSRTEPDDIDNGIPSTDFTRGQAWYDLILAVDPNDREVLISGGIDLFRSTDGANTWDQISKWSNNNQLSTLSVSFVHADQHAIVFKPNSSSEVLIGNDGGVYYTSNVSAGATSSVFSDRINDYNVTQFYACAIHPTASNDFFLAGSQDNGTQRFNAAGINSTTEVYGGDGAYCFIDQTDPTFQIASYIYNTYELSTNGGSSFTVSLQDDQTTGSFINPADYDDNLDILYSGRSSTSISRIKDVTGSFSVSSVTISGMGSNATHFRVSPHTTNSTTLFLGTSNGTIYKVTNADGTPTTTDITGNNLPSASVSCIEIGGSEDTLIATFFNYGVTNVWQTTDGGTSWVSKEGNLPDMPVRWALINPTDDNEVILATELGVWATTNFNSTSPNWVTSSSGLANVRVDMLQYRASDNEVIAATYGRGLFSSDGFNSIPMGTAPVAAFTSNQMSICVGDSIDFTDQSTGVPTSWSWTFSGATTTSSNFQNPNDIIYPTAGSFDVKLVVTNATGSDSLTQTSFITVNAFPNVTFSTLADACTNGPAFALTGGSPANGTYSGPGVSLGMFDPATAGTGTHTITYTFTNGSGCTSTATQTIAVNAPPTVTFGALSDICEISSPITLTGGSPGGGTYSGSGVSAGQFDPGAVATGTQTITYSVTSTSGCTASATSTITVLAIPTVTMGSLTPVCEDANAFTLSGGSPTGGTYSGTGVSGGMFDPAVAGVGTFTVTYTFSSGTGCTGLDTTQITVNALPTVSFGSLPDLCLTSGPLMLSTGLPTGGAYSGPGVSAGIFNSTIAGLGTHTLTYAFTDGNGCSSSATQTLTVIDTVTVVFDPIASTCLNEGLVTLGGGTPLGGAFSGPGVSNGTFDPAAAGLGSHMIVYFFNGGAGCMGVDSQLVAVHDIPTVTLAALDSVCGGGNSVTLSGGSPIGGTFSGIGVSGNQFDPVVAGLGSHSIDYSFTDTNGCTASATQSIAVYNFSVAIVGLDPNHCLMGAPVVLTGNPMGGSFSGTGVSAGSFEPTVAGLGGHTIVYDYNINGCLDTDTQQIMVHPSPITGMITGPTVAQPLQTYFYNIIANNGSSYSWAVSGGTLVNSANNVSSVMWGNGPIGTVTVIETDALGCTDSSFVDVEIDFVSLPELEDFTEFKVYPNPARNQMFVAVGAKPGTQMEVKVLTTDGRMVYNQEIFMESAALLHPIQTSSWANGLYLMQVSSSDVTWTEKILIKK